MNHEADVWNSRHEFLSSLEGYTRQGYKAGAADNVNA